jgi:uncharacterized protein (TIGR02996 family)
MNDREILLRAICAAPDDDAPRLAYADWLEENGDSRQAEFIRVQIALARMHSDEPNRTALMEREQVLWRELKKWRYILGDWLNFSPINFHRGFNMYWVGTARDLLQTDTFWRFGPVTRVRFSVHSKLKNATEAGATIGRRSLLQQFREVEIDGRGLCDAWLQALLQSPFITDWQRLSLYSDQLTDRSIDDLAKSILAKNKCRLYVDSSQLTPDGRAILGDLAQ